MVQGRCSKQRGKVGKLEGASEKGARKGGEKVEIHVIDS